MSQGYRAQQRAEQRHDKGRHSNEVQTARQQPPQQRTERGSTESRGQIGHTANYVRVDGWRNPALTAAVTAATEVASQSVPVATLAGAAVELGQRFKRLSPDEVAVFDVLERLAQGGSKYRVSIDEDRLLAAMDSEMDREDRKRLLANMKSWDP